MPNLLELNLSKNVIGPSAAQALNDYLSNPSCPLEKLTLQHSDVDDFEFVRLIQGLAHNQNLRILDIGENKIGSAEAWNTVSQFPSVKKNSFHAK